MGVHFLDRETNEGEQKETGILDYELGGIGYRKLLNKKKTERFLEKWRDFLSNEVRKMGCGRVHF